VQGEWIKNKQPYEIINKIMNKWIGIFESPKKILTDNGREFQNEEMYTYTEALDIEIKSTAAECPWSNGKCERMVELLKERVRKMIEEGNTYEISLSWIIQA